MQATHGGHNCTLSDGLADSMNTHIACTPTEAAAAAALQLEAAAADQQQNNRLSQRPTDKPTDKRGKHKKPMKSQGEEARHSSSVASRQRLLEDTRALLRKGVFVPVSWGHRNTVSFRAYSCLAVSCVLTALSS
jgi:exonuclease VII large subunit